MVKTNEPKQYRRELPAEESRTLFSHLDKIVGELTKVGRCFWKYEGVGFKNSDGEKELSMYYLQDRLFIQYKMDEVLYKITVDIE